jgi:hypothetical protein
VLPTEDALSIGLAGSLIVVASLVRSLRGVDRTASIRTEVLAS